MSLRKVYGGTPVGNESRCDTCTYAGIIQGYAESERIVLCGRRDETLRVPFNVMSCSDYLDKRVPALWELKQIAWDIHPKAHDPRAGFVLASELDRTNEEQAADSPEVVPAAAKTK